MGAGSERGREGGGSAYANSSPTSEHAAESFRLQKKVFTNIEYQFTYIVYNISILHTIMCCKLVMAFSRKYKND